MSKRKIAGHRIAIDIKTKRNVFFSTNISFKKHSVVMDELNDYNSSPDRSEDRDVTYDEGDDDSSAEIDLKSDNGMSTSPMIEPSPIEISASGPATHSHSKSSTRSAESMRDLAERCKHIPMRLTEDERRLLSVLENALEVCEYTDTVDVTYSHTGKSKQSRIIASLIDVLSISCGLLVRPFILHSSVQKVAN